MNANGARTRIRIFAAAWLALLCAMPAALAAQENSNDSADDRGEAAAIAQADSVRAALVQPPGSKGTTGSTLVRAPFRLFAGTLGVVGGLVYGAYKIFDDIGAVRVARDVNQGLESADIEVEPAFIGSRSGVAITGRWNGAGTPLFLEGGYSMRGYQLARGGLSFGDTLYGLELGAGHHKLTQVHFWGIGPDASLDDRSDFGYTRRDVSALGRTRLLPHVRLTAGGGWEQYDAARGRDDTRPDLQDVFADALPFGANGRERFAHVDGELDVDFTSVVRGDRLRGVRALGGWSGYRGVSDTDSEFQVGSADLRFYLPVSQRHELAVRGMATEVFREEGDGVPLYLLPRLGSTEGLRGFRGWRFRDRAVLTAMAEWRYQVWWHPGDPQYRVDAFLFADHGAVGSSLDAIERGDFVTTPGIGLRFLDRGIAKLETFVAFNGDDRIKGGVKMRASF